MVIEWAEGGAAKRAVDILMITHNRPDYTRLALSRLLDSCDETMRVWLWHNGDHAPTLEAVRESSEHPRVHRFHVSPDNRKLREPTNWVLEEGDGAYFAKVDDDCLVVHGWHRSLIAALESDERMGIVACWHFQQSDFNPALASHKIQEFADGQKVMLNRWVQGSGIMMKRTCIEACGSIPKRCDSFTPYCTMIFEAGWKLGWPLPLVPIEHMDDPRSPHSRFKSEADFAENPPLGASFGGVRSLAEWTERVKWLAREVQAAPLDPRASRGWRGISKRIGSRVKRGLGIGPAWRVAARKASVEPGLFMKLRRG